MSRPWRFGWIPACAGMTGNNPKSPSQGFTMIGMAMVLIIVGLLVGGILLGKDLIRAAELRSVSEDVNKIIIVSTTFREKYHALPGTFTRATELWGEREPCNVDPPTNYDTHRQRATFNGWGENTIGMVNTGAFLAFQHLSNAGMYEGSYTGCPGADYANTIPGLNVPESKIQGGGFTLTYYNEGGLIPNNDILGLLPGHVIYFGSDTRTYATFGSIISPEEARSIDIKMDDGFPLAGIVVGLDVSTPTCSIASADPGGYAYNSTISDIACPLLINPGF